MQKLSQHEYNKDKAYISSNKISFTDKNLSFTDYTVWSNYFLFILIDDGTIFEQILRK